MCHFVQNADNTSNLKRVNHAVNLNQAKIEVIHDCHVGNSGYESHEYHADFASHKGKTI